MTHAQETILSRAQSTCGALGARLLAVALAAPPVLALAAGSSGFAPRIESVHELIVDGDRPEISACLYEAQLVVSRSHRFERIRWSARISDESLVREYRLDGDWVRTTIFDVSALIQRPWFLSRQRWVPMTVECRQVNEKTPLVNLRPKPEKSGR